MRDEMLKAAIQGLHKAADDVLERRHRNGMHESAYQHGWHDAMDLCEKVLLPILAGEPEPALEQLATPFGLVPATDPEDAGPPDDNHPYAA